MANMITQKSDKNWTMYNGDCCEVINGIPDNSIHFGIHSPPFSSLYIYSESIADMGNCKDDKEFFEHYEFLIKELYRTTVPGRLVAVHCKNLVYYKNQRGSSGLRDFRGDIIRSYIKCGFDYHSEITIWKDPAIEMQRTKSHGLLHNQLCKDSTFSRQGLPDYVVLFRKWSKTEDENILVDPVKRIKDVRFNNYIGEEPPTAHDRNPKGKSILIWQKYASPVWHDIKQTRVLNFRLGKEDKDSKHICVAKDSLVLTKQGHKKIQDIEIGDLVLTHKGNWKLVIAKEKTSNSSNVVNIKAQGVCDLTVTPTHKLWARCGIKNKTRKKEYAKKATPEWVEAGQLDNFYLNTKLPQVEIPENKSKLHWWIVGRWLADGHIDQRNVAHISCGKNKVDKFLAKVGDIAGNPQIGTAYQFPLKDKDKKIRSILAKCRKLAHGKHLPPESFTLPKEYASELLNGYLSGNGHFNKKRNRWYVSSVSKELLIGIKFLIQRVFGDVPTLHKGRKPGFAIIEGRKVNTRQDWIMSWGGISHSFSFIAEDGAWLKVKSIKDASMSEVWNLRVQDDESYTVDSCIVKNCPLQLDVIERCIELWTNKGDVVLSPFAGIGSEGYCSLKSERKFIGIELKKSYFDIAVKNLKQIENENNQLKLF